MHIQTLKLSKLRPPALPSSAIARPHLLRQLRAAVERGGLLSLLNAPIGYGKSTLLAQYAADLTTPWGWLRCDEGDNQPLTLLMHLHRAIGLAALEDSAIPLNTAQLWAQIVASLEQGGAGFTLILDDLQRLRAPAARRYLEELLHHPPAGLHILAASDGTPALALSHLHRDRRLHLLGAHQLSLDTDEIEALASARGQSPSGDLIYQLRATSEGWISGVLFGLTAYGQHPQSPGQTQLSSLATRHYQALLDQFFEEELLFALPLQARGFLASLAVVNVCDAALASYLSARSDAGVLLARLQHQGLFIQQCDDEGLQYRLHPQLRQTLYQGFRQRDPVGLKRLHHKAAEWLLERQCYAEAIYQLGRAHDFNALLAAVERHSFDLLREGQVGATVDFLTGVPEQNSEDHLTLAITEASTVIVTNDIERASACLLRLQRLLRRQAVPERRTERAQQTLAFLRSRLAFLGGNFVHGIALVDTALQRNPTPNAATAVLLFNRACCLFALGQLHRARKDAEQALTELQSLGFSGYINLIHLQLGLIELAQGQGAKAAERFSSISQCIPSDAPQGFYDLYHHLGQGIALLQQGQLPGATERFAQAETIALGFPHCAALPWVLHYQALGLAAQGNLPQARARCDEARRLARQFKLFALYRQAGALRVRLAVCERDQEFLLGWLEEWHWCSRIYASQLSPEEWLAYAWVQCHLGQQAAASKIASDLHAQAATEDNRQLSINLHLLDATLNLHGADRSAALCSLEAALQLAMRQGLGYLLQPEGLKLGELFRQLTSPAVRRQHGLESPLPPRDTLVELLQLLAPYGDADQPLAEPLTRREQDVLRRMAQGQSNQQIADSLYVSQSTVKTHINNLFRKLDATDRESALQAAHVLKLLG